MVLVETGLYRHKDNYYVVVQSKSNPDRRYAKRAVPLGERQQDRVNANGQAVRIRFEYDSGIIWRLKDTDRLPAEEANALSIQYGACFLCGRTLKVKESVERGIGPICWSRYYPEGRGE